MRRLLLVLISVTAFSCGADTTIPTLAVSDKLPGTPAEAAAAVAEESASCVRIQPFYWEIGNAEGLQISGTAGGSRIDGESSLLIASATKWMFASYVLERFAGEMTAATRDALRMLSGQTGFKVLGCRNAETVGECFSISETQYSESRQGMFYYDGGHFQKWGVDHGLGDMSHEELAAELMGSLGSDVPLSFSSPQLAGGIRTTPGAYAVFLQKILRGELKMREYLGKDGVCTLPAKCSAAGYSPAPEAVHYSYGHWVEDDPENGDGAFSSAGLFGFYPWISADKKLYGIVARQDLKLSAGWDSLLCGREIRKAIQGTDFTESSR